MDVVDLDDEAVPAAGNGLTSVGHGFAGRSAGAGDPDFEAVALDLGEDRPHALLQGEPEVALVESESGVDVIDDETKRGHG